jgi:hypothetical protein
MAIAATAANSTSLLGWVLTIAIIATILVACFWVMTLAGLRTMRFLEQRDHGNLVVIGGTVLTVLACFLGLWLPLGVVFLAQWLRGRLSGQRPSLIKRHS